MAKSKGPSRSSQGQLAEGAEQLEFLRQFIGLLEGTDVTELSWSQGDVHISVQRGGHATSVVSHAPANVMISSAPASAAGKNVPSPTAEAERGASGHTVTSPFVGTFYRTPAPDQPPFVDIGSVVKKGQVLCIVEAMKLMNEIESDKAGTVKAVLVEHGQPVEYGQPLFVIE